MFQVKEDLLEEYARLGVEVGVNLQKGQFLVIDCPVEAYELARICAKVAYEKGASKVVIEYADGIKTHLDYVHQDTKTLSRIAPWQLDKVQDRIDQDYCNLYIIGEDPDELADIDPKKLQEVALTRKKATDKFQYYFMNSVGQWSILAYPEIHWARKVFPGLSDEEAMNKLWEAILKTSRVEKGKTVQNWKKHVEELSVHSKIMNDYSFKALHYKNNRGTDLRVGLVKNHIWEGGSEKASGKYKVDFVANIPTEEIFTMPDRYHIDGTVVSTKPLSYEGKVIPEFELTFKDGKVISYKAKENEEVLKNILETDEGSKSLGEAALISYDSPISNSNILFYETLFDENASCHLALGASYPTTVKGGDKLSKEELKKLGGNQSLNHVDFMFGSSDMSIDGETENGEVIPVFRNGNFIF